MSISDDEIQRLSRMLAQFTDIYGVDEVNFVENCDAVIVIDVFAFKH